jgi:hypothetical protein
LANVRPLSPTPPPLSISASVIGLAAVALCLRASVCDCRLLSESVFHSTTRLVNRKSLRHLRIHVVSRLVRQ